jgi:hypothetical protein
VIHVEARLIIPSNAKYAVPQLNMLVREVEDSMERTISLDEWDALA